MVYTKSFYEGVMIVGDQKGKKVQAAKPLIRKALLEAGQALVYYEPEGAVVSRSGDDCIVAKSTVWYIDYGEESWKTLAKK